MSSFLLKLPPISSSSSTTATTTFKPTTKAPPKYVEFETQHRLLFPFLYHRHRHQHQHQDLNRKPKHISTSPPPPPPSSPSPRQRRLPPLKVALQGPLGSYCHEASLSFFPRSSSSSPSPSSSPSSVKEEEEPSSPKTTVAVLPYASSLDSAFSALDLRHADLAVAPFENSLDGPIPRNLDLLLRHPDLRILRELLLPVNHCLLSLHPPTTSTSTSTATATTVRRVLAHPQAISHCRSALSSMRGVEVLEVGNPAEAARHLSLSHDPSTAVIGSRTAAAQFGLAVVQTNLQDDEHNYTRFLQLGLKCSRSQASGAGGCKTAVAFALERGPSDMFRAMWAFESRGVTVNRVEHRPNRGRPVRVMERGPDGLKVGYMDYVYMLEVEGSEGNAPVGSAIRQLREVATVVRVLGSYDTCEAKTCR